MILSEEHRIENFRRVAVIIGTRPEAVKLAPVIGCLSESSWATPTIVATGQHRDLLHGALEVFGLEPDLDFDVYQPGATLEQLTARLLTALGPALADFDPAAVVVQGDTTSTMTGALAGFYAGLPVAHVEAGLRTGDRTQPFPEEINRRLTSQVASLHLAPTARAEAALAAEGITGPEVLVTGNTVIDALQEAVGKRPAWPDLLADLDDDPRRLLLVTAHRRESWGQGLRDVGEALGRLARARPDLLVVFPAHPNPLIREAIAPQVDGCDNVRLLQPLSYGPFARLLNRADIVLTDSGGIQEEAPGLGKPVLVMRAVTERPEAVEAGCARLVGTDPNRIVDEVTRLLDDPAAYAAMARVANPFGDGRAARRCVDALGWLLGHNPRPAPFVPEAAPAGR